MSGQLATLQTVRLKGRIPRAEVAGADTMVEAGLLVDAPMVRLTEDGRARLVELLAAERARVDPGAADHVYERFLATNARFKALITQWQLERDAASADAAALVVSEVDRLHRDVLPVIADASALAPRLGGYADRLDAALRKAEAGDMSWLTRPMVDSFHTVWFELHEELIGLAGRTRASEAESGSAG
ncbi:MAG: hypothetical protein JWR11_6002 [Mycobacterium sp.]|nr:hypothetical protein [Mycobacterium sp.]MDT5176272.1 hypothetical protein [Mycobacterium sp.]